jgi:hypothetical protein
MPASPWRGFARLFARSDARVCSTALLCPAVRRPPSLTSGRVHKGRRTLPCWPSTELAFTALGATPSQAAFTTVFFLVALLFTLASGAHRGLRAVVDAVGAGLIGVLIVTLKALLH